MTSRSQGNDPPGGRDAEIRAALATAVQLHRAGQLSGARELYGKVLDIDPEHPDALHFLGVLAHQVGLHEQAIELIARAIARAPDHADAHLNLGNVFLKTGQLEAAAECYQRVIALRPDSADAYNNLGTILHNEQRDDDAIGLYRQAIAIDAGHADAHFNLGNALRRQDQIDAAIDEYLTAVTLKRYTPGLYRTLGLILYSVGRTTEASDVYRRWLEVSPDSPAARHMLAACSGDNVPPRASNAFVRQTFDRFAEEFDSKLAVLNYRAPELVFEALAAVIGQPAAALTVLDAGCGTGLCASLLRPYASRLIGVDLSPSMLQRARARDLYDELTHAELTAYMRSRSARFDAIVSADTLVYFGPLEEPAAAAAGALRPGGTLVFTVEEGEEETGVTLGPHGRYAHGEVHVRSALERAGLAVSAIEPATLRTELGKPVAGLVVTARKPGASGHSG